MHQATGNNTSAFGSIFITLDKGCYTTGSQVNGTVMLNISQDLRDASSVWIHLTGQEHVYLVERKSKTHTTGTGPDRKTHTEYYNVYHDEQRIFFKEQFCVYTFPTDYIPRGQYSFPISFMLKKELPSTFFFDFEFQGTNFGTIAYTLEAETRTRNGAQVNPLEVKVPIIVNQDLSLIPSHTRQEIEKEVTTWCCCNKGKSKVVTHFEKSSYFIGEKAILFVELDNTQCSERLKEVRADFVQILTMKAQGFSTSKFVSHQSTSVAGIGGNESRTGPDAPKLELPVATRGNDVIPTCVSSLINNNYELRAVAAVDACTCCDTDPTCVLKITLTNPAVAVQKWAEMPQNWSPQVMNPFTANLNVNMNPPVTSPGPILPPGMIFNLPPPAQMGPPNGGQMGGPGMAYAQTNPQTSPLMNNQQQPNQIMPF